MAQQQDLRLQIQALEQLKIELEELVNDLETRGQDYLRHVNALKETGLDVNLTKTYESKYWQPDYQMLSQLRQHIQQSDIKYIEKCLASAKAALASYEN